MTDLGQLLQERGIQRVVVIDDAFDATPRCDELDDVNWTVFFDDLTDEDHRSLAVLFPDYEQTNSDELRNSQVFVNVLWENRHVLSDEKSQSLFGEYETANTAERAVLDALIARLTDLDLTCVSAGRDAEAAAIDSDLVIVDLFLGRQQTEHDIDCAIQQIGEISKSRESNPPLVILMSRSTRLKEKRDEFRDRAFLYGSIFRVASKAELAEPGTLERILTRLAHNYPDAKKVASFIHAWDEGLYRARTEFVTLLRRLDLSDLAQLRTLLLEFEGAKLGDYLLDIADRVLQHEIEGDPVTIEAAHTLNSVELDQYPAPHLTGSANAQNLVHRMIFQHHERLRISNVAGSTVLAFGDLLRKKTDGELTDSVLLVVTPACDLVRDAAEDVLVLPGTMKPLTVQDWTYKDNDVRTPAFTMQGSDNYWIKWRIKERHTIPMATITDQLRENNDLIRVGRMREVYAIEIQQQMLSHMGRIGQLTNPPASFPVSVTLYAVDNDHLPSRIEIPELNTAVCFVGRDQDSNRVDHLVLSEEACDCFQDVVKKLNTEDILERTRNHLEVLKTDLEIFAQFEQGLIEVPHNNGSFKPLCKSVKGTNHVYMNMVRNDFDPSKMLKGNDARAPVILHIVDVMPED